VTDDPRLRASDADRDRVTALLREHHAAGRLTAAEFSERMDQALQAQTRGQLDGLMTDLPAIDLYRLPGDAVSRARPGSRPARPPGPAPGSGGAVARRMSRPAALWLALAGVFLAAYLALGVGAGIWGVPVWLLLIIPILMRRRRR
jgi:hypothetical protein